LEGVGFRREPQVVEGWARFVVALVTSLLYAILVSGMTIKGPRQSGGTCQNGNAPWPTKPLLS
jgi:hypothetical protein